MSIFPKQPVFIMLTGIFIFAACGKPNRPYLKLPKKYQTVTFLGDTLHSEFQALPSVLENRIDSLISVAKKGDDMPSELIWKGRKLAYQGNYRDAIGTFSEGMKQWKNDARFFRHRGHRYLTLRAFDGALRDLEYAAELIEGTQDFPEPDGLPNAQNIPRSTTHTNIWYHLGLTHYLRGNFSKAAAAFEGGIRATTNDDMLVANLYWYYMTLRRMGKDSDAGRMLAAVKPEMDIIENHNYHKLLLVFKGYFQEDDILSDASNVLDNVTIGYGLGNWHYINGRKERAISIWKDVYATGNYTAFGLIAAEVELARLEEQL